MIATIAAMLASATAAGRCANAADTAWRQRRASALGANAAAVACASGSGAVAAAVATTLLGDASAGTDTVWVRPLAAATLPATAWAEVAGRATVSADAGEKQTRTKRPNRQLSIAAAAVGAIGGSLAAWAVNTGYTPAAWAAVLIVLVCAGTVAMTASIALSPPETSGETGPDQPERQLGRAGGDQVGGLADVPGGGDERRRASTADPYEDAFKARAEMMLPNVQKGEVEVR